MSQHIWAQRCGLGSRPRYPEPAYPGLDIQARSIQDWISRPIYPCHMSRPHMQVQTARPRYLGQKLKPRYLGQISRGPRKLDPGILDQISTPGYPGWISRQGHARLYIRAWISAPASPGPVIQALIFWPGYPALISKSEHPGPNIKFTYPGLDIGARISWLDIRAWISGPEHPRLDIQARISESGYPGPDIRALISGPGYPCPAQANISRQDILAQIYWISQPDRGPDMQVPIS